MRNHNAAIKMLCSFVIAICVLFAACSEFLPEEDPSKGTIILNFGGVPTTSRSATIGDLVYEVKIFNADIPGDDGTDPVTLGSGGSGRITLDPGNYNLRVNAYLHNADYAEGMTTTPVQVIAGENTSATITLRVYVYWYLTDLTFSTFNVVDLPLAIYLSNARWVGILTDIGSQPKDVNLDLSGCTVPNGVFDPDTSITAGKSQIISLILPNSATAIQAGSAASPTFAGFIALTSVIIPENVNIANNAFDGNNALHTIDIHDGCNIGLDAFQNCGQITSVTIGAGVTYSGVGTGIHGSFDTFADPFSTGLIQAGTYTWNSTSNTWS